MRLEGDDEAALHRPRRGEHGGDLGRMVAVVVDDQDAVGLAANFEAPFGAAELAKAGGDLRERQAQLEPDRDGRQRVLQVVASGHLQRQIAERDRGAFGSSASFAPAAPPDARVDRERTERHVVGRDVGGRRVEAVGRDAPRHPRRARPRECGSSAQATTAP